MLSKETFSKETFSKETFSKETISKETFSKETFSKEMFSKEMFSKETFSKETYSKETFWKCSILPVTEKVESPSTDNPGEAGYPPNPNYYPNHPGQRKSFEGIVYLYEIVF